LAETAKPERAETGKASLRIAVQDGSALGEIDLTRGTLSFRPSARQRGFAKWLHMNAEPVFRRLHEEFLSQSTKKD
jgi:ParB family chromosome partitioning protein